MIPDPSATKVSARAVNAAGSPISGLTVEYASLDSAVATVGRRTGRVTILTTGHVRVVARTIAYGVAKADTMTYTVQPWFTGAVSIGQQGFSSGALTGSTPSVATITTIVAGGIIGWYSYAEQPTDVTFDATTNVTSPPAMFCDFLVDPFGVGFPPGPYCGTGNIAAFSGNDQTMSPDGTMAWRYRQFPVSGTYPYHSTTTGATGQIVVVEPIAPLP